MCSRSSGAIFSKTISPGLLTFIPAFADEVYYTVRTTHQKDFDRLIYNVIHLLEYPH